jgi:hypothetical protein
MVQTCTVERRAQSTRPEMPAAPGMVVRRRCSEMDG